jgi:hypothetical protein
MTKFVKKTQKNWRSGKTGDLAKLALWQTGALAKLTSTLANWRSGETGKTGTLAKLALWQNWRSGKTGTLANWRPGKTD